MKTKLLFSIIFIFIIIIPILNCGQDGNNQMEPNNIPSDSNTIIPNDNIPSDSNTIIPNDNIPPVIEHTSIKIASWNVENWGKTKSTDPVRMRKIAEVIKEFDLIAVQEISNVREQNDFGCPRNEDVCPGDNNCGIIRTALEKYLNEENGLNYEFIFSPQIKDERYLFIYNPDNIELECAELVNDPEDSQPICDLDPENTGKMIRQPFKGKFKAGYFDFVLLTVHTSPSINIQELEGLAYFYEQTLSEGEPDVIILGDLNADCSYLKADDFISFRNSDFIWLINDNFDTTVSQTDCAYDRFIFQDPTIEDFTGNWGIINDIPDSVSDHYLIWAEFSIEADSD